MRNPTPSVLLCSIVLCFGCGGLEPADSGEPSYPQQSAVDHDDLLAQSSGALGAEAPDHEIRSDKGTEPDDRIEPDDRTEPDDREEPPDPIDPHDGIVPGEQVVLDPCDDLSTIDFGFCEAILGWGVIGERCTTISGCSAGEQKLFSNQQACESACRPSYDEWPNPASSANSDAWLAEHHRDIRVLRPRVLLLNFVNTRTSAEMMTLANRVIAATGEGTRYHGYEDPEAEPMVEYEIFKAVDLTDDPPPAGHPHVNSTLYPREDPVEGYWGFDYEQLFNATFASYYDVRDDQGELLDLCDMINDGLVHEVWVYGDASTPDVNAAEILELKPYYDENRVRTSDWDPSDMGRCAGNGCFDAEDVQGLPGHCGRTIRVGWINHNRGPGCFVHSLDHGLEKTGRSNFVPYLQDYFLEFAGFDLNRRFDIPLASWYACSYTTPGDCVTFGAGQTISWDTGSNTGSIDDYVPACGNVHFPPNARDHYDVVNPRWVDSTCQHFRMFDGPGGADQTEPFNPSLYAAYQTLGEDCGGEWDIWWRQNVPGFDNLSIDDDGEQMLSWWPFVYY